MSTALKFFSRVRSRRLLQPALSLYAPLDIHPKPQALEREWALMLVPVTLVLGLGTWLTPFLGHMAIGIFFLMAIALSGLYLTRLPLLLVCACAMGFYYQYVIFPPFHSLAVAQPDDSKTLTLLYAASIICGALVQKLKQQAIELRIRAEQAKKLHESTLAIEVMEETQKLYKTLLHSVSHELKTPLVSIMGSASALLDPVTMQNTNLTPILAQEILLASQRLRRVVENLLDMSRLDSGMLRSKQIVCDARDLLALLIEKIEQSQRSQEYRRIDRSYSSEALDIHVDPVLVEQALTNVIQNCLQYTPLGSTIEVKTYRYGSSVRVVIRDHGKGIAEKDLEHVFKKFYRASPQNPGGLGLGLAIAQGFIEAQGGTITASNAEDGGAVFTVDFPAWRSSL